MTHHNMKLNAKPFNKIAQGTKTVELRLWDEKRRQLAINDLITFSSLSEEGKTITKRIEDLVLAATFTELLQKISPLDCGYEGEALQDWTTHQNHNMHTFYSIENEQKYGVVGIVLKDA